MIYTLPVVVDSIVIVYYSTPEDGRVDQFLHLTGNPTSARAASLFRMTPWTTPGTPINQLSPFRHSPARFF